MGSKKLKGFVDRKGMLLIIFGSLIWSLTMVKSGLLYDYGLGFWGANGHDGIWHISVAQRLAGGGFSLPIFSGAALQNYHIGFDLLLAIFHKVTTVPIVNLYFQVIPPILALLIGVLTHKFVYLWQKDKAKAYWSTFFVYFGGSLGWVVTLFRNGSLGGESMFWSQQAISTLINPPFALSLVSLLIGLIYLLKYIKAPSIKHLILTAVFFGILIQIKVYAGLLALGGLLVAGVFGSSRKVRRKILKAFVLAGALSLFIVLPFSDLSKSVFVFRPFWFLESMMQSGDRIGWERFGSAMANYWLAGNWIKGSLTYIVAFLVFFYGNLGTRFLAEVELAKIFIKKKRDFLEVIVVSIIFAGLIIPMVFLQRGTSWNTIQFFYYSLFFLGILTGISFVNLARDLKLLKTAKIYLVEIVLVLATIPTTLGSLANIYLPSVPPAKLDSAEIEALEFLKGQGDGVVLTYPVNRGSKQFLAARAPKPLSLYESTAYVSAFSGKVGFLEDEVNLDIIGIDWHPRKEAVEEFFSEVNVANRSLFLKENDINYIYLTAWQREQFGGGGLVLEKIFENDEVDIYKTSI